MVGKKEFYSIKFTAAQSTIAVIQRFQNKVLRDTVNAPWYIRNTDLHRDLNMEMVTAVIWRFARKHEARFHQHFNVEAIQLLDNSALVRMLKCTKPFELVWWFPVLGTLYHPNKQVQFYITVERFVKVSPVTGFQCLSSHSFCHIVFQ